MTGSNKLARILVVDDSIDVIDILGQILSQLYTIQVSTEPQDVIKTACSNNPPHLILLDVMMPGLDGFEVCRLLKSNNKTKNIPVIFITSYTDIKNETKGFDVGGADYISKPINPPVVLARVKAHLALYNQQLGLEEKVRVRTNELKETRLQVIQRLSRAAEFRDNETGMHVMRMSKISQLLGLKCGMSEAEAELLLNASPMHDVGKIGIPDHILLKPEKLDADEWRTMQHHVEYGVEIIGIHDSDILSMARVIALTHHEKWDGSGYPNGLSGEDIPLVGRIVAIADVFDALISKRHYKNAWTMDKALGYLQEQKNKHFEASLVDKFLEIIPEISQINSEYEDA